MSAYRNTRGWTRVSPAGEVFADSEHPAIRLERAALALAAELMAREVRGRPLGATPVFGGLRRLQREVCDLSDALWTRVLVAPPGTRELG